MGTRSYSTTVFEDTINGVDIYIDNVPEDTELHHYIDRGDTIELYVSFPDYDYMNDVDWADRNNGLMFEKVEGYDYEDFMENYKFFTNGEDSRYFIPVSENDYGYGIIYEIEPNPTADEETFARTVGDNFGYMILDPEYFKGINQPTDQLWEETIKILNDETNNGYFGIGRYIINKEDGAVISNEEDGVDFFTGIRSNGERNERDNTIKDFFEISY